MGVVGIHGGTGYRITMRMQCLKGGGIKVQRTNEGERERPSRKTEQNAVPAATPQDGVPQADLERFAAFLMPIMQSYYETEEGQRLFEEWKREKIKTSTSGNQKP